MAALSFALLAGGGSVADVAVLEADGEMVLIVCHGCAALPEVQDSKGLLLEDGTRLEIVGVLRCGLGLQVVLRVP